MEDEREILDEIEVETATERYGRARVIGLNERKSLRRRLHGIKWVVRLHEKAGGVSPCPQ